MPSTSRDTESCDGLDAQAAPAATPFCLWSAASVGVIDCAGGGEALEAPLAADPRDQGASGRLLSRDDGVLRKDAKRWRMLIAAAGDALQFSSATNTSAVSWRAPPACDRDWDRDSSRGMPVFKSRPACSCAGGGVRVSKSAPAEALCVGPGARGGLAPACALDCKGTTDVA